MTPTLALILNGLADTLLLGGLAYMMVHPRKLTPHKSAFAATR